MFIDWSKMRMPKLLFWQPYKNLFKKLGLHHASVVAGFTALFSIFGFGEYAAFFWTGWYASREWGWDIYPPKVFEVMDFLSPAIVCAAYMYWIS